jgi:uncharacterized protein (DUF1778 family)
MEKEMRMQFTEREKELIEAKVKSKRRKLIKNVAKVILSSLSLFLIYLYLPR